MSGKRYPNVSMLEYQEIWRNQKSAEEESACGFFDRFRREPADKKDEPLNPDAEDDKDKKSAGTDKDLYPPIVTIDGRVDTDIDHLIEDLADEYKGPVDEIPSKFPKPHVFSVIEGSLDDDVDSYANDDGTMEHTLVDTPKSFNPKDLKDVASNDGPRAPGHSRAGQLEASHTDRSHNKMNVDNEVGHDGPKRDEPSRSEVSRGDQPRPQEERMQPDAGHKTFIRHADRKHTPESSTRKQRTGEGILMQKSFSCLDGNRGQAALNLMRSESAEGHDHAHRYQALDSDADLALNSRTVALTQCDSSAHTTEVRDCCSYKDSRFRDTESAVCSHAYTESLSCTFTDESFRDGHASLDMSVLRAEHDHSQSLSDTESVSDLQMTSNPRRPGRVEMYESYDYKLETKVGMDAEHRLYHFPSYSDDSLTKSSELYPKSRYMTKSTSHLTSRVQPGPRQARPSSDPPTLAESAKSSHSHNAAVPGFHSESCQDRRQHVRVVANSVGARLTPQSTCPPGYPHPTQPENTPLHQTYLQNSPAGTAYLDNAFLHSGGTRKSSTKEPHRFDKAELQVIEANVSNVEDRIPRGTCQLDDRVQDTTAYQQRQPAQKMLEESYGRVRELEGQLTAVDFRGEAKCPRSPSHPVAVGTPKEYRPTSTQNEMVYEDSTSLSRVLGIQVTTEDTDRTQAAINRGRAHAHKTWAHDPAGRNVRARDAATTEKSSRSHVQAEQMTGDVSDTESLDSEANYLLRQLQMTQMTKRKANNLLKHVQNILEQTETVGDTSKREVDEGRVAARAESERGKHSTKRDHTPTELHLERSPRTHSICATRTGHGRSTARELELNNCPAKELQPPDLRQVEAGDRGLVQTLVNTWDKHHKAVTQGKVDTSPGTVARSQTKGAISQRWSRRPSSEHRDKYGHEPASERQQWRTPATCDRQLPAPPATHLNRAIEGSPEKRSLELEISDNRVRGHCLERSQRWQKHGTTEPVPGSIAASRNVANDSTSLASVSLDSVSVHKQEAAQRPRRSKHAPPEDVVDMPVTSAPRKPRNKRRSSPEVYSRKDALKSKWRFDIDTKRMKVRSASIKDSLRAAFKVAEESMTAAARVAEALNIVMKASLISPPSSSSLEDRYTRPYSRAERKSPVIRSKRLEPATTNCRSKIKPGPAQPRSPEDVSLCLPTDQPASRHKGRKLDNISERPEKKKRSSHNNSTSKHRSFGHKTSLCSPLRGDTCSRKTSLCSPLRGDTCSRKTSLCSPLRGDTCSRKPRSRRASNHQLDTKVTEYKQVHSKSSVTLEDISPQAWGDSTAVSKHVPGHIPLTNDQQIIVQVAYTNSPELAPPQPPPDDSKVQMKKALTQNKLAKDDHHQDMQGTMVSLDVGETLDSLKADGKKSHAAPEPTLSKSRCIDKKQGHGSPSMSEHERSSTITLSKEEWVIPNAGCSTGRKVDSYFTHNPPVIDHNLHSISMSAKQIIRRQLVGSCVDPGCTDSTYSDSVESNSNFNRSAAGRQLHLNIARQIERQQRQTKMNQLITSKCRQEMELSQSADPFIIWQCDASLQYEGECYTSDTNVFLHPDRGKPWPPTQVENDSPQKAYNCISRSREESNTSRRATVHVQDNLRTSYQLHEQEILHIEDYFESSCTNQEPGPCVAALCYTDLSSPVSGCFNLPEYGSSALPDQGYFNLPEYGSSYLPDQGCFNLPEYGSSALPDQSCFNLPEYGSSDLPDQGCFNLPEYGSSDLPDQGCFNLPEYGRSALPDQGCFNLPEYGSSDLPDQGCFNLPEYGRSALPDQGCFNLPEYGRSDLPDQGCFNLPEYGSSDLPDQGCFNLPEYGSSALPDQGCFNLPEYGSSALPDQGKTRTPAEVNVSQHKKFDRKYDMSQHAEFDRKSDMPKHAGFDPKYDMSQPSEVNRKYDMSQPSEVNWKQQTTPDDRYQSLEGGDTLECPRDPPQGQSTPAPKPRARKLLSSESDCFPLPGRTAQITKFSPIFEEFCPEEIAPSYRRADRTCPELNGRSQDVKGSNTTSSSNCSIRSNSSSSSNNNNNKYATAAAADVDPWRTEPGAHTNTNFQAIAARKVSRLAHAVASSHGNTSTSTKAQPACRDLHATEELNYTVPLQSLACISLGNIRKVRSVGLRPPSPISTTPRRVPLIKL